MLFGAPGDDHLVESGVTPGLEQQRDVGQADAVTAEQFEVLEPRLDRAIDGRMQNRFEIVTRVGIGEDDRGERAAIERAVAIENRGPEPAHDRFERLGMTARQLARDLVGVHGRNAELLEALARVALARGDAPGQGEFVDTHIQASTIDAARGFQRAATNASAFRFFAILRRRDAFLDERVPLVAVRTLPEQLVAAVPAPDADVRIAVEDRFAADRDVAARPAPAAVPAPSTVSQMV